MTIAEFKAWLDGFEAAMNGAPTEEQWAKIKAKLEAVKLGEIRVDTTEIMLTRRLPEASEFIGPPYAR